MQPRALEPYDVEAAREGYLEALGATIFAGRIHGRVGPREVAAAARSAPPGRHPPRPTDLLLDALATRFTEGYVAGVAPLRHALDAFGQDAGVDEDDTPALVLAAVARCGRPVGRREVARAGDVGRFGWVASPARSAVLPLALGYRAFVHLHAGEFAAASALIEEGDAITEATGSAPVKYPSLLLAAWRGVDPDALLDTFSQELADVTARGEARGIGGCGYTTAVLYNSLGRYEAALAAARLTCEYDDLGIFGLSLVELVEAAVRTGAQEEAAAAFRRLEERTNAVGTDWALGVQAWSRALLSDGQAADAMYREAIERLARSRIAVHLARAHLMYGEWLRRESRRIDARVATSDRARHVQQDGGRVVRRARPSRASGNGRDGTQSQGRDPAACSPTRRLRSPVLLETAFPTLRSGPSCTSAGTQWNGT